MKGKLLDFSIGYNGKQRITIEVDGDFREGFDKLKGDDVEVSVRKWRAKRSKDANAYFHVLVNAIAEARGVGDTEVKRELVVEFGAIARDEDGNKIGFKLPACVNVDFIYPYTRMYKTVVENGRLYNCYLVYKHSSEMDTKEMSRLIEGAIETAAELGIDTDTPERLSWWNSLKNNGR